MSAATHNSTLGHYVQTVLNWGAVAPEGPVARRRARVANNPWTHDEDALLWDAVNTHPGWGCTRIAREFLAKLDGRTVEAIRFRVTQLINNGGPLA